MNWYDKAQDTNKTYLDIAHDTKEDFEYQLWLFVKGVVKKSPVYYSKQTGDDFSIGHSDESDFKQITNLEGVWCGRYNLTTKELSMSAPGYGSPKSSFEKEAIIDRIVSEFPDAQKIYLFDDVETPKIIEVAQITKSKKWNRKANMEKIVSFDFDDTIFKLKWDTEENDFVRDDGLNTIGELNLKIDGLIRQYAAAGWKVVIVTSRYDVHKQEVIDFVKEHNLPISEIYCTNGENKINTLMKVKAQIHYDDDKSEIDAINRHGEIKGILV